MPEKKKNGAPERVAAAVAVAVLAALILPILLVGDCAHPFGDDLSFARDVHRAMEEGSSILGAAVYTVKRHWIGWQGTYSAMFLMALQPGIWGEEAYFLTAWVMLLMLIVPTALFTHTVLRRWLGQGRAVWAAATAGILLVTIQNQPSPPQAFFWWNGAVFYTFFHGLMLLLMACMLRLRLSPRHPRLLLGCAIALAVVIGGGNYVTGLLCCLMLAACILLCLLFDRAHLWQPVTVELVLLPCFLFSVLAPGNGVRQAIYPGMGPMRAIAASLVQGARNALGWLEPALIGLLLCLIPLLWRVMGEIKFSFPWPVAVSVLLFLAFACQYTPHFYGQSTEGPGRMMDIIYDVYVWIVILGEAYWLGWLRRRLAGRELPQVLRTAAAALGALLLLIGLTAPGTTARLCAEELIDGSAGSYDEQMTYWEEVLSRPGDGDVVIPELTARPKSLYVFTIAANPEDFANQAAANYYGKTSVSALPVDQLPPSEKD